MKKNIICIMIIIVAILSINVLYATENNEGNVKTIASETIKKNENPPVYSSLHDPADDVITISENKWNYYNLSFFEKLVTNRTSVIIAIVILVLIYISITRLIIKRNNTKWKIRKR